MQGGACKSLTKNTTFLFVVMRGIQWNTKSAFVFLGDALDYYDSWPVPTVIISDGPYGVGGYPGDPRTPERLPELYRPHLEAWTRLATPMTTLWFWNTELGWAVMHKTIESFGWEFRNCHIWDKGIAHVAGNVNGKTMRKFPVVTEVCVQYVRKAEFRVEDQIVSMQEWLREECSIALLNP